MSSTVKYFLLICMASVKSSVIVKEQLNSTNADDISENLIYFVNNNPENVFNGVYSECFVYLSYTCLQEKTLLYLKELNKLSEVPVIGEYVKFVKINKTKDEEVLEDDTTNNSDELSELINKAVDRFFNGHILKFNAFGKDVSMPNSVEEFVGRKRKGGGGGGGGGVGGGHGHDDKKKMMMMAMMCMKMKLMVMVPAMMGMMGMMSFKGMMFSMMSFMVSKMMLLMKILEKKGGVGGGGGGGGGDGGWAAGGGGGGGGAWMPAGGQDYGGGGYDANGQWQSRSIADVIEHPDIGPIGDREPIITYIPPLVRKYHRPNEKLYSTIKKVNGDIMKVKGAKSRKKRGIVDLLQNAYAYWINQILGAQNRRTFPKYPKHRLINGVRYVYQPTRYTRKPNEVIPQITQITQNHVKEVTPIITAEEFNKGEILEGPVESRSMKKKVKQMYDDINEVVEDNPWE